MKRIAISILIITLCSSSTHGDSASYSFRIGDREYAIQLDDANKSKTIWDADSDLPTKVSDILKKSRKHLIDSKVDIKSFAVESVRLETIPGMPNNWYYIVTFESIPPPVKAPPSTYVVVLLLDGSIVPAIKEGD